MGKLIGYARVSRLGAARTEATYDRLVSDAASLHAAWARADRAKVREIASHRRAITFQEDIAARFELRGLLMYAATARARARRARGLLEAALSEQAAVSAQRLRWVQRNHDAR